MKFSIITPSYNSAKFLEHTIEAVLDQRRYVDLEYIMVDGGSTDGSLEIIDRFRSEFSHCIDESDKGPAEAEVSAGLAACDDQVTQRRDSP